MRPACCTAGVIGTLHLLKSLQRGENGRRPSFSADFGLPTPSQPRICHRSMPRWPNNMSEPTRGQHHTQTDSKAHPRPPIAPSPPCMPLSGLPTAKPPGFEPHIGPQSAAHAIFTSSPWPQRPQEALAPWRSRATASCPPSAFQKER